MSSKKKNTIYAENLLKIAEKWIAEVMKNRKLKKTIGYVLIFVVVAAGAGAYYMFHDSRKAEAAWWNDSWQYRKPIAITNSSGSDLTDFQVKALSGVDLSSDVTAGKVKSDLGDLRFTDINGEVLPYWIEDSTTSSVDAWVKINSLPASGAIIYMYYGNAGAGSQSNPSVLPSSCSGVNAYLGSGNYYINPDGAGPFQVYCDMGTNGGGWTQAFDETASECITQTIDTKVKNMPITEVLVYRSISGATSTLSLSAGLTNLQSAFNQSWTFTGFESDNYKPLSVSSGNKTTTLYIGDDHDIIGAGSCSCSGRQTGYAGTPNGLITFGASDANTFIDGGACSYNPYDWTIDRLLVRNSVAGNYNISIASPSTEEKGTGPVAYWAFDEGYGTTVFDATANKNNGALTDMSSTASSTSGWQTEDSCVSGKCLAFDGGNDYVSMGDSTLYDGLDKMTISLWLKQAAASSDKGIIGKWASSQSSFLVRTQNSAADEIYVFIANALTDAGNNYFATSDLDLQTNQWSHLEIVYDGSQSATERIRIYKDGVLKSGTVSGTIPAAMTSGSTANLRVGSYVPPGAYFNGKIDEPKIYNYARTAAQIKMDYNVGLAGTGGQEGAAVSAGKRSSQWLTNGLVGHWKMDEASWNGTTGEVIDASGNGNNGTASSAAIGAGKFGNGGSFDGAGDYVDIATVSYGLTNQLSSCSWVNATTLDLGRILSNRTNDMWEYGIYGSKIRFELNTTGGTGTFSDTDNFTTGTWKHVCVTYDGGAGVAKIYIDGVLKNTSTSFSGNINSPNSGAVIGRYAAGNSEYINGKLDEVRLYNRALSDREVRDLYAYAPGPVGYWNFEEGSGTAANDSSSNGNTGTLTNGPNWTQGQFGKAIKFDGSDDYIDLGNNSSLVTNTITIEGWIKLNQLGANQSIFDNRDIQGGVQTYNVGFFVTTTNKLSFLTGHTSWTWDQKTASTALEANKWYHVAATVSGTSLNFYINGVNDTSTTISEAINLKTSGDNAEFGATRILTSSYQDDSYFKGSIDDVKIYNYARTQKQIMEDMQARGTSAEGGQGAAMVSASGKTNIAYWKFDEGQGATAYDQSPQKNNATISGATWSNNGKFGKALSFDGSDDYVSIANNTSVHPDYFTVSAWIYQTQSCSDGNVGCIIMNNYSSLQDFIFYIEQEKLGLRPHPGTDVKSNSTLSLNQWNHVVATYDGSKIAIYINGEYDNGGSSSGMTHSGEPFVIGRAAWYGGNYFKGLIDEVKLYNFALTADEVKAEYNFGSSLMLGAYSADANGVASSSAASIYCVPGSSDACLPPVAEWKFEEGSGAIANDTSGNGNNGTLTNGPTYTTGKIGKALKFDGSNDYISMASSVGSMGTGNWSIGFWWKSSGAQNSYTTIIGQGFTGSPSSGAWAFKVKNANNVVSFTYCMPDINNNDSSTNANDGYWHYIEGVRSGTSLNLYMDNVLIKAITLPSGFSFGTGDTTYIGYNPRDSVYINGLVDDLKIYNYARTPAQIAWDYNKGAPVGWWRFDECQGTTIKDKSDFGINHGTWYGTGGGTQTSVGTCTVSGATAWYNGRTGKINASMNFDGTDDRVVIPSVNVSGDDITVSFWLKGTRNNGGHQRVLSLGGSSGILFNQYTGYFEVYTGGSNMSNFYYLGEYLSDWHHFLIVVRGNDVTYYVDGKLHGSKTDQGDPNTSDMEVEVGCEDGVNCFQGYFDDIRIYNYALTPYQVKVLYNGGAVRFGN